MNLKTRIKLFFMSEEDLFKFWKHEIFSRQGKSPKGETSRKNGRKGGRPSKQGMLPFDD